MFEEDDSEDWQSGPFCRHWSDPADCELCRAGCANCGHGGEVHALGSEALCEEDGCQCPGWQDQELPPPV